MKMLRYIVALMLVLSIVGCGKPAVETEPTPTETPPPETTPPPVATPADDTGDDTGDVTGDDTGDDVGDDTGDDVGDDTAEIELLEGEIELKKFYNEEGRVQTINPLEVKIGVGTTVTWANTEEKLPHVVTAIGGDVQIPGMKSLRLAPGEKWSYTFEEPGVYEYIDVVFGCKGKIIVE